MTERTGTMQVPPCVVYFLPAHAAGSMKAPLLVCVLLLASSGLSIAAVADAPGPLEPVVEPGSSVDHSAVELERLQVDVTYLDPLVRGAAGVLEVSVTPRLIRSGELVVELTVEDGLRIVGDSTATFRGVAEGKPAVARYVVSTLDEGVHAFHVRAIDDGGHMGIRNGWLFAEGLAPARIELDYRRDEPIVGPAVIITTEPLGTQPQDAPVEEPEATTRPWPAPLDDVLPPAFVAAADMGATSTSFSAKVCWNFSQGNETAPIWTRQRWATFEARAELDGPDKVLVSSRTGPNGCTFVTGLPRTVDGAPTQLYFVFRSCNNVVCVVGDDAPNGYAWKTGAITPGSAIVVDFGERGAQSRPYAGRVFAYMNNGWSWFVNQAQHPKSMIPAVDVNVPGDHILGCTCYSRQTGEIYIAVNGVTDHSDDTNIHEYAHHVHWNTVTTTWPSPGGTHRLCDGYQNMGLSWTEGFAYFAAVRANFDLGNLGVAGATGDRLLGARDIETSTCGDASGASASNEWRVSRSLWDLIDHDTDGVDDGWWSLPDLMYVVRVCESQSFPDFYASETCGWRQLGRSTCVMLRASYQNKYDFNEAPRLTAVDPLNDRWVRGSVQLNASVEDKDLGVGNCPTWVTFSVSKSSSCVPASVVGTDDSAPHSATWDTRTATNGAPYYVCASATDGMEIHKLGSLGRLRVDNEAPTVTIDHDPNSRGWNEDMAHITTACVDMYSGEYSGSRRHRIDNGTWTPFSGITTIDESGEYWYEVMCWDQVGNVGSAAAHIRVDATDPITLVGTTPGDFAQDRVEVRMVCIDTWSGCQVTRYALNAGNSVDYTGPFNITSGVHKLHVYSIDNAGNLHEIASRQIGIDLEAPTVTVTNSTHTEDPFFPGWHDHAPEITIECSDALAGAGPITYRINGGRTTSYTGMFLLETNGANEISATCEDKVGNVGTATKTVKVDTVAPEMEFTLEGPRQNGWYTGDVELQVDCVDEGTGVRLVDYRLDGGNWTKITTTRNATLITSGTRFLEVRCSDWMWNKYGNATLHVDREGPTVTSSTDSQNPAAGPVQVRLACADAADESGCDGVIYRIDGGAWIDYALPFTVSGEGTHLVEYQAIDAAGIRGVGSRTVTIDLTGPVPTATLNGTLGGGDWYTSPVVLSVTCAEDVSGIASRGYRLDRGAWASAESPVTFGVSGDRALDVRCVDGLGNEGIASMRLRIDRDAPATVLTREGDLWTNRDVVNVTLACSDAGSGCAQSHWRLDGGAWTPYRSGIEITSEGRHLVEAYSVDVAGNAGTMVSVAVNIDRTPPRVDITLDGVTRSDWFSGPVNATVACRDDWSGVAARTLRYATRDEAPYTGPTTLGLEGEHTATGGCYDVAGNSAFASELVRIDTTAPVVVGFDAIVGRTSTSIAWNTTDASSGVSMVYVERLETTETGSMILTVCTGDGGGNATYSGRCTVSVRAGACYRLVVHDVAGWTTWSTWRCP